MTELGVSFDAMISSGVIDNYTELEAELSTRADAAVYFLATIVKRRKMPCCYREEENGAAANGQTYLKDPS